jgi:membrane-associated protein
VREGPLRGQAAQPAGEVPPLSEGQPVYPVPATARQGAAESPEEQEPSPGQASPPEQAAAPRSPWSDPRLPWEGKPRRVDIVCWAAITLSGLYYLSLLPFRASLVGTHPIVMVLLNGSLEAIVSAAAFARVGHGSLAVVLLASIPGLMKFDLIYWWAGRLWGEKILQLFTGQRGRARKRAERFIERVHRWGRWFTWPAVILSPFLPIPNALVYAVAGWTGMSWVTFLVLDAIGTLAWAGMLAGLGYALGQHAVSVAQAISRYGLWVAIAIVVLVVASQLRNARTQT